MNYEKFNLLLAEKEGVSVEDVKDNLWETKDWLDRTSEGSEVFPGVTLVSKETYEDNSSYDYTDDTFTYVFQEGDKYYALELNNQSYSGLDFISFEEVKKTVKEVVVYE